MPGGRLAIVLSKEIDPKRVMDASHLLSSPDYDAKWLVSMVCCKVSATCSSLRRMPLLRPHLNCNDRVPVMYLHGRAVLVCSNDSRTPSFTRIKENIAPFPGSRGRVSAVPGLTTRCEATSYPESVMSRHTEHGRGATEAVTLSSDYAMDYLHALRRYVICEHVACIISDSCHTQTAIGYHTLLSRK